MGSTVEDRHCIKRCETAEIMALHICGLCKMFSEKRLNINGPKTLAKKVVSTGTIERLPGSGHLQQINIHFSCTSYLIIRFSRACQFWLWHCVLG